VWAWFSYDSGTGGVVPLIFARLVGVPTNLIAEVVTLQFIAKPLDFITQKFMLAEELKIRPYYDPIFIAEEKRPVFSSAGSTGDADVVLEGYSALWHIDRIRPSNHQRRFDWGRMAPHIDGSSVPYDSVQITLGQPPLRRCRSPATSTGRKAPPGPSISAWII
jgi:hypothetical protein